MNNGIEDLTTCEVFHDLLWYSPSELTKLSKNRSITFSDILI